MAAFILAGGASSRMGRNKSLLKLAGVPLVLRTAALLEPLVSAVTVIGPVKPYRAMRLQTVDEQVTHRGKKTPRKGPLAGIAQALEITTSPWNLIVAGDLPYLSREWVNWLLEQALSTSAQIVIPRTQHGPEPLAAVYRQECREAICSALRAGTRKVTEAFKGLRVKTVFAWQWAWLDRDGDVLRNMNTPADYLEARDWWDAKHDNTRLLTGSNRQRTHRRPTALRRSR